MGFDGISLFSNCGAGDLGFHRAGFQFHVLAELKSRRLDVARRNHPGATAIEGDLRVTWPRVVEQWRSQVSDRAPDLVSACPPCQGLSTARSDRGSEKDPDAGCRDDRNLLVIPIAEVVKALKPTFVVIENVPAFLRRKVRDPETQEAVSAASLLISWLRERYNVYPLLTDLADFGVPQTRRRAFLTFVERRHAITRKLEGAGCVPYPVPSHALDHGGSGPIKLKDALRQFRLPCLDSRTPEGARDLVRPLHHVPVWDARQYAMVSVVPPGSGDSAWQNNRCASCGDVDVEADAATCPLCDDPLLRPVVKDANGYRLVKGFRRSSYRRQALDSPAATITTASGRIGSNSTIHPTENRVFSPLECALLQTIPEVFDWGDALEEAGVLEVRAMIGEAVPPLFTQLHGEVLSGLLRGKRCRYLLSETDVRCRSAWRKLGCPAIGQIRE